MPGAIIPLAQQNNKGEPMDTEKTTAQAAPFGVCVLCGRRILTSFYELPGDGYAVRAHDGCYQVEHGGLVGDALTAARAARGAKLDEVERLLGGRIVALPGYIEAIPALSDARRAAELTWRLPVRTGQVAA